jgi:hypothetical protein
MPRAFFFSTIISSDPVLRISSIIFLVVGVESERVDKGDGKWREGNAANNAVRGARARTHLAALRADALQLGAFGFVEIVAVGDDTWPCAESCCCLVVGGSGVIVEFFFVQLAQLLEECDDKLVVGAGQGRLRDL